MLFQKKKKCPKCEKKKSLFFSRIPCAHCGKSVKSWIKVCPKCGYDVVDKPNPAYELIAFLFPGFGFIYLIVKAKKAPKKAYACGMAAFLSMLLSISWILLIGSLNSM